MCGIVGFIGGSGKREEVIERMFERIAHRGPDGSGKYVDGTAALGHVRLSIIDLENGTQPLYNEDRSKVLIFNGEIYNYQELRKELEKVGHVFRTHSDSEVLLHGYEEYGSELLNKLRGMFAFVIWDKARQKLFGARDFFGIKPFYYALMNSVFLFGSEIKAFMAHPDFKKELNEERLPDYLTFACIPGYDTMFHNVFKLPPGHYFEYQKHQLTITKYYNVEFCADTEKSYEQFVADISETVHQSVAAHKIADVEVGCFLSSGVDSSYVACEVSKLQKVRTYTAAFAEREYSEGEHAKMLADEINVDNYAEVISPEHYFASFADTQYYLDEPLGNPSANNLFHLCQRASKDLKVVLSGEGADEMFGGYNVYKEPLDLARYQKCVPEPIRMRIGKVAERLPDFKGRGFLIRGGKSIEERYIGNSYVYKADERDRYLKHTYQSKPPEQVVQPFYQAAKDYDDITKMQYVDIHFWMVQEILLKADKMSMANSLELRVPFLDKEVFALSSTLPSKFRVNRANTKAALRSAANRHMNDTSANRKKLAFPTPLPEWLKEVKYYNIVKRYFTSEWAEQFFHTDLLVKLLDNHLVGKRFMVSKIWTVFSFLVWYEQYFVLNR